jgi:hypothetical protein
MRTVVSLSLFALLWSPAYAHAYHCAQPLSTGSEPTASDCLYILKAAVGSEICPLECVCAPSGTLPVKATDALLCLSAAVGTPTPLDCPCEGTTTSSTVTSTSVTSTTVTTTTVTLPPGDMDNDGLANEVDPCPEEALNRCAGICADDETWGLPLRMNTAGPPYALPGVPCSGQRLDCNGDVWEADFAANTQHTTAQCNLGAEACAIANLEDVFGCRDENTADIIRCEHWGNPLYGGLSYSFDVPDGQYLVNLLFANTYSLTTTVGSRVFDVAIEGIVVLDDFDQVAAAGGSGRVVNRSIPVEVAGGGGLQIEFIPVKENPTIKGIEVLRLP